MTSSPVPEPTDPDAQPDPDGTTCTVDVVFPGWTNHHGTLFAGRGLELVSRAAFIAASRATRKPVVMAKVLEMEFVTPVHVGELVVTTATPGTRSHRSQLVHVQVEAEDIASGARRLALRGSVLMVIVPGRPGPPLWLEPPASPDQEGM